MHNIKLIALDLDGTLLSSEKTVTEKTAKTLEKAAETGVEIVPATGRFWRGMPKLIRELPYVNYVISINGAQVYDIKNQKTVCASEMPYERAVKVMERLDGLDVIYDCYQDGWGWMTKALYDKADEFAPTVHNLEMIKKLRTPVPELKAYLRKQKKGVQKIQIFFKDMALREEMLKALPKEFSDLVVTTSIVNNIEINRRDATKGIALERLSEYLGISTEQTMAFGDDLNDIPMLEKAGIGVAMGNAYNEVKAVADYITDDCNSDGVAKAVAHFLGNL